MNLSSEHIPEDVTYFLSLGDKFNLPYNKKRQIPLENILVDIEYVLDKIQNENVKLEKRNKAVNIITNFITKFDN